MAIVSKPGSLSGVKWFLGLEAPIEFVEEINGSAGEIAKSADTGTWSVVTTYNTDTRENPYTPTVMP